MKKRYIISAVGAVGAGAAGFLLKDKDNREKLKRKLKSTSDLVTDRSTLNNAGIPDQFGEQDLAQLENAKMVSEGSQFGVNYYNEQQDEQL